MANHSSESVIIPWQRGVTNHATTPNARDAESASASRADATVGTRADNWTDELQWLTGFPSQWGERRGGWFRGF